jgi:hypothetical protein
MDVVTREDLKDLLDLAAIHTILNRGTVYAVPPANMADDTASAAILRYGTRC